MAKLDSYQIFIIIMAVIMVLFIVAVIMIALFTNGTSETILPPGSGSIIDYIDEEDLPYL